MKLGLVTKLDKGNKTTSKKIVDNVLSGNFDVIVMPDSGRTVWKTYNFLNSILLSYINWKQNLKFSYTALTILLWVKILFLPKNCYFLLKNVGISKIKTDFLLKGIFSEDSSIIITISRHGGIGGEVGGGGVVGLESVIFTMRLHIWIASKFKQLVI